MDELCVCHVSLRVPCAPRAPIALASVLIIVYITNAACCKWFFCFFDWLYVHVHDACVCVCRVGGGGGDRMRKDEIKQCVVS